MKFPPTVSVLLLLGAAVLLTGCAPPAPTREFVQEATRLHEGALAPAAARGDVGEYFQALGERLMDGAHAAAPDKTRAPFFSSLRTHLVASDVPNAFVTGGAHVYVYNGLFQACESEEELAAAMAHAFAHAVNLDVERTGLRPAPGRPLRLVVYDFTAFRFTLEQEIDAHALAYDIYVRAGYNPERFENVFAELADRYPAAVGDRLPLASRARSARNFAAKSDLKWRKHNVADRRRFAALKEEARALNPAAVGEETALFLRAFPNCVLAYDLPEQVTAQQQLRPVERRTVELEPS